MVHYSNCPVCKSGSIKPAFSAKDFTVSKELFSIWACNNCTLMFTQDVPEQEQIGRYYQSDNYISHSDTQKGFINQLYHRIREITLSSKLKLVQTETGLQTGSILDVGCGTGAFLNSMKFAGWKITGLEPDEGARRIAQALYKIEPLPSPLIFQLPKGEYNAITAWHVMEHVHQLHEYVEQIKMILAPKGKAFIAVPNYTSGDATSYKENWAAYDVPRHLYHFSPKSMTVLMKMHGLEVVKIKPMWFDSFYVSMLSEKYQNSKGNIVKAFLNGLASNAKALFNNDKSSSLIYIIRKS